MKMFSKDWQNLEVNDILAMNIYEVKDSDGTFKYCHLDARIPYEHPEYGYRLGVYTFSTFSSVENANRFIDRLMEIRDSENPPEFFDIEEENARIEKVEA